MLTLRAAAALLAQADSLRALQPVARALGFTYELLPVSRDALQTLGLRSLVTDAVITRGPGRLRLFSAILAAPTTVGTTVHGRELVRRLCTTLARNAPTRHWCLLALDASLATLSVATITPHPSGPRVAILRVERTHIVDSDAETLRALAAVTEGDDRLRHARLTDILRRDALSNRFYRALQRTVVQLATSAKGTAARDERLELALLCTSRCLFLAFLEAKGWLDGKRDFLLHHATATLERGGALHHQLLRPLFFGTLNTPRHQRAAAARAFGDVPFLNGGLFAPTALERKRRSLRFTNDAVLGLIGDLLDRYRFTAHEESTAWSEAAVDPEMLGRAFECLMAEDERRRSGSFYTPPALVAQVVRDALSHAIPDLPPLTFSDLSAPLHLNADARAAVLALRVLDPACGSGAFLVHAMESIANILLRSGDARPLHVLRRDTLTRSIFGVDRNPIAVWLCELRLWLSVVIECPETSAALVPPLPNLDHHIRVGDALAGGDFRHAPRGSPPITTLRDRYTRASGRRKKTLAAALDHHERARAIEESGVRLQALAHERQSILLALRTRDLFGQRRNRTAQETRTLADLRRRSREVARHRVALSLGAALPFRFVAHFPDVAALGGFPIILGNPPWVRPHALPMAERLRLRVEFQTMRDAQWAAGAKRAGASAGFAAQADIAAAFVERSTQLLAPGGTLALLVPAKLWRALAGGGTRRFLATHTQLLAIHDWSDAPPLFEAATYPSLIVARRNQHASPAIAANPVRVKASPHAPVPHARPRVQIAVSTPLRTIRFSADAHHLAFGADASAPWILLPPAAHEAFERLRLAGPALGDSPLGRPSLGVKCGCNAAFLVHAQEHDDDTATIHADERHGVIERQLLRPVLRGDAIVDARTPARLRAAPERHTDHLQIIWTHAADGTPLRELPPAAARWLALWRRQLEARRDARARTPWWSLFRTDAARHESARLVWADIGKRLRTRILPAGDPTVPLNSCYVLRTPTTDDAWALSALLSSPLCQAWLDRIAEPARGGFRRYLGWTVACLPIPPHWIGVRADLAALGRRLVTTRDVAPDEHIDLTADAYGVPVAAMQPLLEWNL